MQRKVFPSYDPTQRKIRADNVIRLFSNFQTTAYSDGQSASKKPIFIVGMPRSGTSLLEQILSTHSSISGIGERIFWENKIRSLLEGQNNLSDPVWREKIASEYLDLIDTHDQGALHIIDKMPHNFEAAGLIHTVFPNAKILNIRRNPIDTCLSIYFHDFNPAHNYATDLDSLAHYYASFYHRLTEHWRQTIPSDAYMDVDYENLVADQELWSKKIVSFIGVQWEPKMLEFHKHTRKVGTPSDWQVRQPIYKTSANRWRNYEKFISPLLPLLELED